MFVMFNNWTQRLALSPSTMTYIEPTKELQPEQDTMHREKGHTEQRKLLSVEEVGEVLGIKPQTIYNKMSRGLFPIKHKRLGRLIRFDLIEVDKYLKSLPDYR